jgi:cytochrome c-type biogenesis protein CcmE
VSFNPDADPTLAGSADAGVDFRQQPVVVPTRNSNKVRVWAMLALIVGALGFVLVNGLGDAAQLYKPADEAVAAQASIGTKRFSIIGVVVADTVVEQGRQVQFTIQENGVQVPVRHTGVPPDLFQPGIPVVLDGRFEAVEGATYFVSDRMSVKHSADYKTKNPDRVEDGTGQYGEANEPASAAN